MRVAFLVCAVLFLIGTAQAEVAHHPFQLFSKPSDDSCSGTQNTHPIITEDPTFIKKVENGSLYQIASMDPPLNIVHLYGTPYEMGYAQGELLADQMESLMGDFFAYIELVIQPYISFLPEEMQELLATKGVEALLDLTAKWTAPFTPQHFLDEMQGMADGSGIDYSLIYEIAMFPELIKASCSMFGAWDTATADVNSTLVVLRALDWGTDGPFQKYPLLSIYHPNEDNGHAFAQLGWSGLTGAITGYSSKMAICEKVWDGYDGKSSRKGMPWNFLFRDILQYDENTAAAMKRVEEADRTCAVFLGLGDHDAGTFQVVEYSQPSATVYNVSYENHNYWPTLPFVNKHVQPSTEACLNDLLTEYYGSITPKNTIANIAPLHQTGDMHASVYDYHNELMYISNAGVSDGEGGSGEPAYDRPYAKIHMKDMWNEPRPTN